MALSPNIPTSFVPKVPVQTTVRAPQSGTNVLAMVGAFFLILALVGSAGVFLYSRFLNSVVTSKEQAIEQAQNDIDTATIEEFIRLRNRFNASAVLMSNHVALTQFLDLLEKSTLQNVRYSSLTYLKEGDEPALISMGGVAKSFNSLAAQSNVFAKEPYIKNAIFGDINADAKDTSGAVSFSFSAKLDPRLIIMRTPTAQEVNAATLPPVRATSTPVSTPTSTSATTTPLRATTSPTQL